MKAKEILLLIFIIVAGVLFYHAYTGELDVEFDWGEEIFFSFNEYVYDEYQEIESPLPPQLEIVNAHGNIEIRGTEEDKITILFQKKIRRRNEEKAKEISDKLKMLLQKDSTRLIISSNRDEFRRKKFRTNFTLMIPQGIDVKVKNSYGLVRASQVGNTNISNSHGKIFASDIRGELVIQNSYRDVEVENVASGCQVKSGHSKIFMNQIDGNTRIIHKYGQIHLKSISQDVQIEGSHSEVFGQSLTGSVKVETSYRKVGLFEVGPTEILGSHCDMQVEGVKGSLEVINKYGKLDFSNIQGDLHIDGKSLTVSGKTITGEKIYVSSSYRDITLAEFSGETSIFLSHGNITLQPYPLTHPIEAKGDYADIKFYWPLKEEYPFEAQAKRGEIKWRLPAELSFQEEDGISVIKAFIEEKENPSIFLLTKYGTISIEE